MLKLVTPKTNELTTLLATSFTDGKMKKNVLAHRVLIPCVCLLCNLTLIFCHHAAKEPKLGDDQRAGGACQNRVQLQLCLIRQASGNNCFIQQAEDALMLWAPQSQTT